MESVLTGLATFAVLVAGLFVRFGLVFLVLALIAAPVYLGVVTVRGLERLRRHVMMGMTADGILWKPSLYYAPGHTWVRRGLLGRVSVGLDDLAQRLFVGAASVELPPPGSTIRAGEVVSVIACGDRRAEVRSPVTGTVAATNEAVVRDPSLINQEPYSRGWLLRVRPSDSRYRGLPRGESARAWLEQESLRLTRFLERDLGLAAADGGDPVAPTASLLRPAEWQTLTRAFLG